MNWKFSDLTETLQADGERGRASDLYLCKTRFQREIEATDRQLDQLVYELYGLTEEEIKTVEESKT